MLPAPPRGRPRVWNTITIITDRKARGEAVEAFVSELGRQDGLTADFDERLWYSLVDFATVYSENDVRFTFKNGAEIQA